MGKCSAQYVEHFDLCSKVWGVGIESKKLCITNMMQNYQNKQEINKLHEQRRLKKVVLNTKNK